MKTIRVKVDCGDGYIEAFVENLSYGGWRYFVPDPRKKKFHKPKFWKRGGSCYGDPISISQNEDGFKWTPEVEVKSRKAMKEALRRWFQRYLVHGELGNTQLPADQEMEIVFTTLRGLIFHPQAFTLIWPRL